MKPTLNIDPERIRRVANVANKEVAAGHFSSVEWRVAHRGELVAGGITDANAGVTLPLQPIYRIYSMTKPIVSIAALRLIENGDLYLPSPVSQFIPGFADMELVDSSGATTKAKTPINVEHLLTHRSGLSYDFLVDCPVASIYRDQKLIGRAELTLADFVDLLADNPLVSEPGSTWRYSYSTDVLARVLEVASGKPLQQLLQELVFDPCGMLDTGFTVPESEQHRLLPMFGQRNLDQEMLNIDGPQSLTPMPVDEGYPVNSSTFARGGHGLYSTADDYLKFMQVLQNGCSPAGEALLSAPMHDMMWKNRIPDHQQPMVIGENRLAGYGWNLFGRVLDDPGQAFFLSSIGEGGWAGAAATYFWVDRELDLCGLSMTQYLGSSVPLGDIIRSAAYQSLRMGRTTTERSVGFV